MEKITQEQINEILNKNCFGFKWTREKFMKDRGIVKIPEPKDIPVIKNLDSKILESITTTPKRFEMGSWHADLNLECNINENEYSQKKLQKMYKSCGTTHCRAGWAIVYGGLKAIKLEKDWGSEATGSLIYLASTGRIPNFTKTTNAEAKRDIRKHAKREQKAAAK